MARSRKSAEGIPFDFTWAMRRVCEDITRRVPEFSHIRMDEVAVAFAQARRRVMHGLQAKLTPMRFERGSLYTERDGELWTVQRLYDRNECEMLYILTFYLPRFMNNSFEEKLVTIFHELYHISAKFDGDIRRMEGRYHVHSHSQKEYDREMAVFARRYLADRPSEDVIGFLRRRFQTLQRHHGKVIGVQVPIPKLLPVPKRASA